MLPIDAEQPAAAEAGFPAGALAAAALALARRFAAGATLWCAAPASPSHARHLAVEFVHPVIVGKRALPAVAVNATEPAGWLRPLVRAGDILAGVGPVDDQRLADIMTRAPAWGVTTLWIGAGAPPPAGVADHIVWLRSGVAEATHGGGYVLAYHVLWELAHVCFEHPGLLTPEPAFAGETCITCADAGHRAEVVEVDGTDAWVRTAGGHERVDVSLVGPSAAGDLLLIHAGAAIARLGDTP